MSVAPMPTIAHLSRCPNSLATRDPLAAVPSNPNDPRTQTIVNFATFESANYGRTVAHAAAPGIQLESVGRWLAANVAAQLPVAFELIAGGESNYTFRVDDAA